MGSTRRRRAAPTTRTPSSGMMPLPPQETGATWSCDTHRVATRTGSASLHGTESGHGLGPSLGAKWVVFHGSGERESPIACEVKPASLEPSASDNRVGRRWLQLPARHARPWESMTRSRVLPDKVIVIHWGHTTPRASRNTALG